MALPKKPDRRKTYYKVTNENENHHGLQYHDGLVIDPKPFNDDPTLSCVEGRIYFTTKEHIHKFFAYGKWIRPVKIPKDARVILDPEMDKYGADRLIFKPRKSFGWYFDKMFDKETFPKEGYCKLAVYCSKHFDRWFDKKNLPKECYQVLAIYCSEHFDKWFDKELYPVEDYWKLAIYCSEHFNKWFDKALYPPNDYWMLAKCCPEHFDRWFDKELFPVEGYWKLAIYCPEHFDKWFDKKTFPTKHYDILSFYCPEHKDKWERQND